MPALRRSILAVCGALLLAAMVPITALGSSSGQFSGSGQLTLADVGGAPFSGMVLRQSVSGLFKPLTFPYAPSNGCGHGPSSVEIDFDSGPVIVMAGPATDCTSPQLFTSISTLKIISATGIYSGATGTAQFTAFASGPEHSSGVVYFSWSGTITLP
jgi:hypothetical protein